MANGSHQVSLHAQQESDLQQQGGTKPSSTQQQQQQQQQQGNVKQEQPSAKQQHSDKGMNRPSTANNPELAPPPSQQAAGPASGKLQVQVQADSKQQQQQVKGKQQPKREPMGIAAARAWVSSPSHLGDVGLVGVADFWTASRACMRARTLCLRDTREMRRQDCDNVEHIVTHSCQGCHVM
jgi:hypothetical protein